jgi:dephospho-CoA kinase
MFRLGITGGIGSGKSFVCSILEKFGVPVYYADKEARRLMNTMVDLKRAIKDVFGEEIYHDGELDRQEMGRRIFGQPEMLDKINRMVHPVVREDFFKWSEAWENVPYVIEEAAILFESGAVSEMDATVLIYAPEQLRIERVMARDGLSRSEVVRRINMQMDEEEKKRLADRVILNDEKKLLLPQLVALHEDIKSRI